MTKHNQILKNKLMFYEMEFSQLFRKRNLYTQRSFERAERNIKNQICDLKKLIEKRERAQNEKLNANRRNRQTLATLGRTENAGFVLCGG
ncbi:hypothetical protein ACU6U9_02585 [Pseudomonas sp. HK3]